MTSLDSVIDFGSMTKEQKKSFAEDLVKRQFNINDGPF